MKIILNYGIWILVALFMVACSKSDGEDDVPRDLSAIPIPQEDEGENFSVATQGGAVSTHGLKLSISPHTFASTVNITIKQLDSTTIIGEYEASDYFQFVLPADFAQPIEVSLEPTSEIEGEVFMLVSVDACPTCEGKV